MYCAVKSIKQKWHTNTKKNYMSMFAYICTSYIYMYLYNTLAYLFVINFIQSKAHAYFA